MAASPLASAQRSSQPTQRRQSHSPSLRAIFPSGRFRLETAYQVLDTLTGLKLVGMLGLGHQRLRSSEGFEADGLSSMATLGTEYRVNLLQLSRQALDLALGIYADWTWIGPTFTWTTGEPIYEMSRLRGRMHVGLGVAVALGRRIRSRLVSL